LQCSIAIRLCQVYTDVVPFLSIERNGQNILNVSELLLIYYNSYICKTTIAPISNSEAQQTK